MLGSCRSEPQRRTGTPSPSGTASTVAAGSATLRIPTLHDGQEVALPARFRYETENVPASVPGLHMHVFPGRDPSITFTIEIPLSGPAGEAELPDDKRLTGVKDLTFALAAGDHRLLASPFARITLRALHLAGGR